MRMNARAAAIIGDGSTDRELIQEIVRVVAGSKFSVTHELTRQSLRDAVDRYWRETGRPSDSSPVLLASDKLERAVVNVIVGALADFEAVIGRPAAGGDLLVLSSDAERYLANTNSYFEPWASCLRHTIETGVQRFYQQFARRGYSYLSVPLIISFIPFPSSDIVVYAARVSDVAGSVRSKSARALKQEIYATDDLRRLPAWSFRDKALRYITEETMSRVYGEVIEIRPLLSTLAWLAG
jgi:hypothetical protein